MTFKQLFAKARAARMDRKGQLGWDKILIGGAVALVVVGMVISFGARVNSQNRDQLIADGFATNSTAVTAIDDSTAALGTLSENQTLIALAIAFVVILGLILVVVRLTRNSDM